MRKRKKNFCDLLQFGIISKIYVQSATMCELGNPNVVLHAPSGRGIAIKFLIILSAMI